jgi:hypothetical protein
MEKTYTAQISEDAPFPSQDPQVVTVPTQSISANPGASTIYGAQVTDDQIIPQRKISNVLVADAFNTKTKKILAEFQFTPSGALQIGDYKQGDQGDIRISPNGIIARDIFGNTTISIDGLDGSAIFAGELRSGTLVSGKVIVGDDNIEIDGITRRMLFYDDNGIPAILIGNG